MSEQIGIFSQKELEHKCQENPWLKTFGIEFSEDPFMELDYSYCFTEAKTIEELKEQFKHGNWAIRQGFIFKNLAFINQVNGGDEWWTVKKFPDGELVAFESISCEHIIEDDGIRYSSGVVVSFEDLMNALLQATKEQCRNLTYNDEFHQTKRN